ncbi:MAG: hypothetical protein GXX09_11755 [Syntrophomonadaceae bacterium]|nr:hypothetical protein [Syntrophomonadaceae bacterium]
MPPAHHKATGTTNMLERLFGEGCRRTKVIERFPNEASWCLRLFFATLMAASQSWRGIRMNPSILAEIRELKVSSTETKPAPRMRHLQ